MAEHDVEATKAPAGEVKAGTNTGTAGRGNGVGGTSGGAATGAATELRAGLGAASRLRDLILPNYHDLPMAPLDAGSSLRRMEEAVQRTAFALPGELVDARTKLLEELAILKPRVDGLRGPLADPTDPDPGPVLYDKKDPKAAPPEVGGPGPKPGSHGFKAVDKQPAGIEIHALEAEIRTLPGMLQSLLAPGEPASTEKVSFKLLLQTDHKVAIYLARTTKTPGAKDATKGIVAVIDLVEVATKLAVLGMAAIGAIASFLTGSKDPVLKAVGRNRIKLLLSAPRPNGVPDFVVFDMYQLLRALADDNWSTFRPEEMQLSLLKKGGADPAVTVARYQGDQHSDEKAFKGRGLRVGGSQDQTIVVPGLRKAAFGEQGKDAEKPLYVTGASDGQTVTLAVARDAADDDGVAFTFDLLRVFEIVKKTLERVMPAAAKGIDLLIKGFQVAGKAGKKIIDFLGGVFTIGDGPERRIGWDLGKLLEALAKVAQAGGDLIDAFLGLIPDVLHIANVLLIEPAVAVGKGVWDGLQKIGEMLPIGADILKAIVGALGEAAGDVGAYLKDFAAEAGLVIVDKAKMWIGFVIDLFRGKKKKKRFGFVVGLGKVVAFIAKIVGAAAKFGAGLAGKGADWFVKHLSLGSDLVLRLFLDDGPRAKQGNRVGIALMPLIKSGGDIDDVKLTETFLDGSVTDISYGTVVADPTKEKSVPGAVRMKKPEGGSVATTNLPAPRWMQVLYGIPDKKPMVTELIVGSSDKKGDLSGFHAHIWSQVPGTAQAFDIALSLPIPKILKKRMPSVRPELLRIDNERSKAEKRLVIQIGNVDKTGAKPKGITGWMSWSLDQIFAAESFDDALAPEQLVINDGTWSLTIGTKVSLAPWGTPVVKGMIPPPSLQATFPAASVDVYVKQTPNAFGMLVTDHSSIANRTEAIGVGFEVTRKRLEELKAKLPRVPGAIKKKLPLELDAEADGLKIWLGPKPLKKDDPAPSWAKYSWSEVIRILADGADLEGLIPDQAHLDARASGLALDYTTLVASEVPADNNRVKVKDLEHALGDLVNAFGVTDEHYLHIDMKKSTLAPGGTRVAVAGWVYRELPNGGKQGWKVALEIDVLKLLSRFLPKSVIKKLQKPPTDHKGLGVGMTFDAGQKDKDSKPVPGDAGQPSLKLWIQYIHKRRGKTKEFAVEATWTVADLLQILMHLEDIKDDPTLATPSALSGSAGNSSFELEFKTSKEKPKGTRMDYLEMPLITVLGVFMEEDIANKAQLYLDEDLDKLPARMAESLQLYKDLVLTKASLVLPDSGGIIGDTYSLQINVKPGAIAGLAMMIPGGFYVKLAKFLIDFFQDPEGKTDDMFYTVVMIPLLIKHRDIFNKIDWDSLSAKDVAMMVLLHDNDTKAAYMSLKAFDKLVEAGHIDKDKLPKITKEMARKAAARDPDEAREQIERIFRMPMDELKKQATLRKQAGTQAEYEKIIAFMNSISVEHQVLMRKIGAMYEKKGIPIEPVDGKDWSPERAVQKLGKLEETLKRLEAGEIGNRIEEKLRKGDKSGEGRDGDRAAQEARAHYEGKDVDKPPPLEVKTFTVDQLASVARDGYVVLDGPDGKKYVHHATPDERKEAAKLLLEQVGGKPGDDPVALYDLLKKRGLLALDAVETVEQLRAAGVNLTDAQVAQATAANPKWMAIHKRGPADFGAPDLAVDSPLYAVHIAKLQVVLQLKLIDGIAGHQMATAMDAQKKLAKQREAEAKAKDGKEGAGEGKGEGEGEGQGQGDGPGGDGSGKSSEPTGAYVPISDQEALTLPYYDALNAKLVVPENITEIFTEAKEEHRKFARNKQGESGVIYKVALKQHHVSRDDSGLDPQIGYQFEFSVKPVAQDDEGQFGRDFKVYSKPFVFLVDLDVGDGRGGTTFKPDKLAPLHAALGAAIDADGGVKQTSIRAVLPGGSVTAELEQVTPFRDGFKVQLAFTSAPPGSLIYDIDEKRYLPMQGKRTVFTKKRKESPAKQPP